MPVIMKIVMNRTLMYGAGLDLLRFCILGAGFDNIRCRLTGDILHSHALPHICDEAGATGFLRQLEIPHKLVEDHDPLDAAFAGSLGFVDINAVDELPEKLVCQRPHFKKLADGLDEFLPFPGTALDLLQLFPQGKDPLLEQLPLLRKLPGERGWAGFSCRPG